MSKLQHSRVIDLAMVFKNSNLPPYVVADIIEWDSNRTTDKPRISAYDVNNIVQTVIPIMQPLTMADDDITVIKRPSKYLRATQQWTDTRKGILERLKHGKQYIAIITPDKIQPDTILDIDFNSLTFPPQGEDPRVVIGYDHNGKLNVRVEDYPNENLDIKLIKSINREQAIDLIMQLATQYKLTTIERTNNEHSWPNTHIHRE